MLRNLESSHTMGPKRCQRMIRNDETLTPVTLMVTPSLFVSCAPSRSRMIDDTPGSSRAVRGSRGVHSRSPAYKIEQHHVPVPVFRHKHVLDLELKDRRGQDHRQESFNHPVWFIWAYTHRCVFGLICIHEPRSSQVQVAGYISLHQKHNPSLQSRQRRHVRPRV